MVAVHCELLLGSYQAADPFGAASTPEWPPHPYRLHAALVAAACEAGGAEPEDEAVHALEWLESQGAPAISCSLRATQRVTATSWVPRNPTRGPEWSRYVKAGSAVNRVGRVLPTAVPDDPVVTFAWPEAGAPPRALDQLVEGVGWLGSSRSPAACALTDVAPRPVFVPDAGGEHQVRVAAPGITRAMLGARFEHPSPPVAVIAGYAEGTPRPSVEISESVFPELLVRATRGAVQDAADAPAIGRALRLAVLSRAGDAAPAALHGHDPDRGHAAYLTLADVGHIGARGAVRGVALAIPADATAHERLQCARALAAVDRLAIGGGRGLLRLDDQETDLATLSAARWRGPARRFATVTPVVLDRFPRRGRTVEDELRVSLVNAGFPDPAEVEALAGPALVAGPTAGALCGEVPSGLRVHARVVFAEPIFGPLVAGRGRFHGVGLFLPERPR